jgi:myo-inositol-1(or 4)-monophosphatase
MKTSEQNKALAAAVKAARMAGGLMRRNLDLAKKINSRSRHDIKLALDVRCQKIIETILLGAFPASGLLGEEGMAGVAGPNLRWVVDPIDGTVNFTYGVPHACVSIALQERGDRTGDYATVVGVVYDPFCDELWTAARGTPARLNGKIIHVSRRKELAAAMVAIGFAKDAGSLRENLPVFNVLVRRALKIRMTGSAALALAYVACGRFDAYLESGIHIWDIAAGGFIIERAGGEFWRRPITGRHKYRMLASNGLLRRKIERVAREARLGDEVSVERELLLLRRHKSSSSHG